MSQLKASVVDALTEAVSVPNMTAKSSSDPGLYYNLKDSLISAAICILPRRQCELGYQLNAPNQATLLVTLVGTRRRTFHQPIHRLTPAARKVVRAVLGDTSGFLDAAKAVS